MKAESFSPHTAAQVVETTDIQITYAEFLELSRERRLAELEQTHPGESARNNNIAGNIVRAVRAFMKANDLDLKDVLGPEMRDETCWEAARDRMGVKAGSQKSLTGKARIWALEAFRSANSFYDEETFGERLSRLRRTVGLEQRELAAAVSASGRNVRHDVIAAWEYDRRRPSVQSRDVVRRLESVLGVAPGTLTEKMPKVPYRSAPMKSDLPQTLTRRIAQHIPADFDTRSDDEQEEILTWVAENILSTPKELDEDGKETNASTVDLFPFALAREPGGRCKVAPKHLLMEIDELVKFKTALIPPRGLKRDKKRVWSEAASNKCEYDLRAFFGALDKMGLPKSAQSLSIILAPEAIERFIEWRYARRGAYTRTLSIFLELVSGLLHEKYGFVRQMKGFGAPLREIPGFIDKETVDLANSDWSAACARARKEVRERKTTIEGVEQQGRETFESILPALEAPQPLAEYWKIVEEIRNRMPGEEYPVRRAEALRSLIMLRLALGSGLRSKNKRELLFCPKDGTPKTKKQLRRLERGELRFLDGQWWISIPGVAFKNATSPAVMEWNDFPLMDPDGMLDVEISAYLDMRHVLLAGHEDPGTLLVKTMRKGMSEPTYTGATPYYAAFRAIIVAYGIYNPWTGRGAIEGLRPHGPHSVRHILGTHLIKNFTASDAAAALFDTEQTVRKHYGFWATGDRHRDAMEKAFQALGPQLIGGGA